MESLVPYNPDTDCPNHCDHCCPDDWHACALPKGHAHRWHTCDPDPVVRPPDPEEPGRRDREAPRA